MCATPRSKPRACLRPKPWVQVLRFRARSGGDSRCVRCRRALHAHELRTKPRAAAARGPRAEPRRPAAHGFARSSCACAPQAGREGSLNAHWNRLRAAQEATRAPAPPRPRASPRPKLWAQACGLPRAARHALTRDGRGGGGGRLPGRTRPKRSRTQSPRWCAAPPPRPRPSPRPASRCGRTLLATRRSLQKEPGPASGRAPRALHDAARRPPTRRRGAARAGAAGGADARRNLARLRAPRRLPPAARGGGAPSRGARARVAHGVCGAAAGGGGRGAPHLRGSRGAPAPARRRRARGRRRAPRPRHRQRAQRGGPPRSPAPRACAAPSPR